MDTKNEKLELSGKQVPLTELSSAHDNMYNRVIQLMQAGVSPEKFNEAFNNVVMGNQEVRNTVLKNLKSIPYIPDRDEIERALQDPRNSERLLRSIGSELFYTCYPLYKLVRFYSDVLTYKNYVHSQGVKEEIMNKPRYQKEKRFVQQWIDKLNPTRTFRRITAEVFKEGKRAYVFREDYTADGKARALKAGEYEKFTDKNGKIETKFVEGVIPSYDEADRRVKYVMLKELPDDYIKIIGVAPTGSYYTISFNFAYFMDGMGTDINDYPPIFKEYLTILEGAREDKKSTNQNFDMEKLKAAKLKVKFGFDTIKRKRRFYCWVDMPSSEVVVFSSDESTPIQAPNFLGLYLMSVDLQAYNILQQQLTGIPLNSLVVGSVPVDKTNQKSPMLLNDEYVTFFTDMINSVMPAGTTFVMTPSEDNKIMNFNEQPNATKVYTAALQDLISTAGMAGLLSTTDKPSLAQIKTSQLLEARYADILYPQYQDCINRRLERMTDMGYLRYDWKFHIYGDIFSDEKDSERLNKHLATGQIYYLPKALSYENISICDAEDIANEVIATGIYDKLMPLVSSFQQSGNGIKEEGKRPEIDDSDVDNENTAKSKDAGTNTKEGRIVASKIVENSLEIDKLNERIKELEEMLLDRSD